MADRQQQGRCFQCRRLIAWGWEGRAYCVECETGYTNLQYGRRFQQQRSQYRDDDAARAGVV